ncbi:hypothetical protein V6N13_000179 [Hibiscus sabdariffa]
MREPRYPLPRVVLCIHDKVSTSPPHTHRERGVAATDDHLFIQIPWRNSRRGVVCFATGTRVSPCHRAGFDNDPSAGSPTETLLRLLLPLNDKACFEHSNFFKVTAPEERHRPIKARSASPAVGTSRPVLTVRRTGRPTPRSNYELFNCNNLNIRYWSWNYRGCWHQTCPPMDPR